jgi:hypothetical protein
VRGKGRGEGKTARGEGREARETGSASGKEERFVQGRQGAYDVGEDALRGWGWLSLGTRGF